MEAPLLSVEAMTEWYRIGPDAIALAEKLAADAYDLRQVISGVYTSVPLGVWIDESGKRASIELPVGATQQDYELVKAAVLHVMPVDLFSLSETQIKVAYSPTLHGAGELAGFFPRVEANGALSGSPSPVRAMLTSGLVGAGLGYGAGALGEYFLPEKWKRGRLRNTLAAIGGGIGAAPGALWGASNLQQGKSFNDPSLLYHAPDETPQYALPKTAAFCPEWQQAVAAASVRFGISGLEKEADYDDLASPWGQAQRAGPTPMDVNIDAMNRTLWDNGASPQLAGATLGALAAAQQMPGGRDEAGWVTPSQMASLAAHMGAGYASGAVVGSVLGLLTGMSDTAQTKLKNTGALLGIVQAVIPRLFGGG
jgi:hypothetical protein